MPIPNIFDISGSTLKYFTDNIVTLALIANPIEAKQKKI